MTQLVTVTDYTADSNQFALTNGAKAGRVVVVVATQQRQPADISTATFNGVAPTVIEVGRFDFPNKLYEGDELYGNTPPEGIVV
jgi:hypothetical protein